MAIAGVLCPVCNTNTKYWHSKMCWDCRLREKRNRNPDSKWNRNRERLSAKDRVPCEFCNGENRRSRTADMCMACLRKKQRAGRIGTQYCSTCHCELNDNNWYAHRRKWWHRICNSCWDSRQKDVTQNPSKRLKRIEKHAKYRVDLKGEMITAYGGKCQCCGETEPAFMTIDHIDGRGKSHRAKTSSGGYRMSGDVLYRWLKKHNWPKDNYQLMCMNCNFAKSHNPSGCPHQHNSKVTT